MSDNIEILRFLIDADISGLTSKIKLADNDVKKIHKSMMAMSDELSSSGPNLVKHFENQSAALKKMYNDALSAYVTYHKSHESVTREMVDNEINSWRKAAREIEQIKRDARKNEKKGVLTQEQSARVAGLSGSANRYKEYQQQYKKGKDQIREKLTYEIAAREVAASREFIKFQQDFVRHAEQQIVAAKSLDKTIRDLTLRQKEYDIEILKLERAGVPVRKLRDDFLELGKAMKTGDKDTILNQKAIVDAGLRVGRKIAASKSRKGLEANAKEEITKEVKAKEDVVKVKIASVLDPTAQKELGDKYEDFLKSIGSRSAKQIRSDMHQILTELNSAITLQNDKLAKETKQHVFDMKIENDKARAKRDEIKYSVPGTPLSTTSAEVKSVIAKKEQEARDLISKQRTVLDSGAITDEKTRLETVTRYKNELAEIEKSIARQKSLLDEVVRAENAAAKATKDQANFKRNQELALAKSKSVEMKAGGTGFVPGAPIKSLADADAQIKKLNQDLKDSEATFQTNVGKLANDANALAEAEHKQALFRRDIYDQLAKEEAIKEHILATEREITKQNEAQRNFDLNKSASIAKARADETKYGRTAIISTAGLPTRASAETGIADTKAALAKNASAHADNLELINDEKARQAEVAKYIELQSNLLARLHSQKEVLSSIKTIEAENTRIANEKITAESKKNLAIAKSKAKSIQYGGIPTGSSTGLSSADIEKRIAAFNKILNGQEIYHRLQLASKDTASDITREIERHASKSEPYLAALKKEEETLQIVLGLERERAKEASNKARLESQIQLQIVKSASAARKNGATAALGTTALPARADVEKNIRDINQKKADAAKAYNDDLQNRIKTITNLTQKQEEFTKATQKYDHTIEQLNTDLAIEKEILTHIKSLQKQSTGAATGSAAYKNIYDKVQLDIIKNSASTVAPKRASELARAMAESRAEIEKKRLMQEGLSKGLKEKLDQLPGGANSKDDPNNKKEIIKLTKEYEVALRRLNAERKKEQDNLAVLNSEYQSHRKMLYDVQNAATNVMYTFGAMAISSGAFIKKIADSFGEVESKINTFKSVTFEAGDSMEEINTKGEAFRKTVLEIAKDTKFTASEIIEAGTALGKMGFSISEVSGIMGTLVTAAEATGESLTTVAETVSSVLNQFDMDRTVENVSKVTDELSYVANKTAASFSSLNESLKYVGPIAHAAGNSLSDTAGILGFLSDRAISGSTGATVMSNAMLRLAKVTPEAGKVLNALGVDVFDPLTKRQKTMREILPQLADALKNMGSSTRLAAINMIFGERATKGMAAALQKISSDGGDAFISMLDDVANKSEGMTQAVKNIAFTGLVADIDRLKNSMNALYVELGEKLAPTVGLVVNGMRDMADSFSAAPDWTQSLYTSLGLVFTAFTGIVAIGALVVKSISGIVFAWGFLSAEIAKASLQASLFGKAMLFVEASLGPIGWTILAVGAALTVLTGYILLNKDAWEAETKAQEANDTMLSISHQKRKELAPLILKEAEGHRLNSQELMREAGAYHANALALTERKKKLQESLDAITGKQNETNNPFGIQQMFGSEAERNAAIEEIKAQLESVDTLIERNRAKKVEAQTKFFNERDVELAKTQLQQITDKLMELARVYESTENETTKLQIQKQMNEQMQEYITHKQFVLKLEGKDALTAEEIQALMENDLKIQQRTMAVTGQITTENKSLLDLLKLQNDARQDTLDLMQKQADLQDKLAYANATGAQYELLPDLPEALTPDYTNRIERAKENNQTSSDAAARKQDSAPGFVVQPPDLGVQETFSTPPSMAGQQAGKTISKAEADALANKYFSGGNFNAVELAKNLTSSKSAFLADCVKVDSNKGISYEQKVEIVKSLFYKYYAAEQSAKQAQSIQPPKAAAMPSAQQPVKPKLPTGLQFATERQVMNYVYPTNVGLGRGYPGGPLARGDSGTETPHNSFVGEKARDVHVGSGSPVRAAHDGVVVYAAPMGGYGNCVVVDHQNGTASLYAHNSQFKVGVGQHVSQGQLIALSGSTGHSTGPHGHFELIRYAVGSKGFNGGERLDIQRNLAALNSGNSVASSMPWAPTSGNAPNRGSANYNPGYTGNMAPGATMEYQQRQQQQQELRANQSNAYQNYLNAHNKAIGTRNEWMASSQLQGPEADKQTQALAAQYQEDLKKRKDAEIAYIDATQKLKDSLNQKDVEREKSGQAQKIKDLEMLTKIAETTSSTNIDDANAQHKLRSEQIRQDYENQRKEARLTYDDEGEYQKRLAEIQRNEDQANYEENDKYTKEIGAAQFEIENRNRQEKIKTYELAVKLAETTLDNQSDDINAAHNLRVEQIKAQYDEEYFQASQLYANSDELDSKLSAIISRRNLDLAIEQKKTDQEVLDEKIKNAKILFDVQMSLQSQLIELMPAGITKTMAEIRQKYEIQRKEWQTQADDTRLKPEARHAATVLSAQSHVLEDIELSNARFAAQSKMLDIQREKLNLLQQQTAVGRDLASVMQSISQSDASTNLVDMVNSFNDLTKDVKELSFSDIASEIENNLNTQLDAMNEKYALNAERIRVLTKKHEIMLANGELDIATDEKLQGLIQENAQLEIQCNEAIKARQTLLSDEFKEYAAIKEQLDDIKKAYVSINEAGNNLSDVLSGLTGSDALGGGLKDMLKLGETAIGFTDKLIKAKAQIQHLQDQDPTRKASLENGNFPTELLNAGFGMMTTSGLGGATGAGMAGVGEGIGAAMGATAAAAFTPAMALALLPLLPDLVNIIGGALKKFDEMFFPESSEAAGKFIRENQTILNEILDKRDAILRDRGDMSEALFSARSLERTKQNFINKGIEIYNEYVDKLNAATTKNPLDFIFGKRNVKVGQGYSKAEQEKLLKDQYEANKQLLEQQQKYEENKTISDSFKRTTGKQQALAQSANDMKRIAAALGHSEILAEQADFEKKQLDSEARKNEALAKLLENPDSIDALKLFGAEMSVAYKQEEQDAADHAERMAEIQDRRNQTKRDNDLQAIQLDLNLSDHQKKIAEIRAEEASKQAELDRKRRTADPADYSAIDEAKRLAHIDMLHKLADEARNASEALLALDRSLAATRAALTPDKNDDLKAALDSDLDAIRNAAYEQRRIHAGDVESIRKIDEAAQNQSLAKIREFNQQVMANQIEIGRRESAIKVSQLEQAGKMEESVRASALAQAQSLIDELEALAQTSGRDSQEFILKSQETQNQIYAIAVEQYQKIVDLRRQDLADFIEIETLKYQNAKDIMGQAYAETKGNIYQLQLDRMAIQNGPKNEANARKLAIIDAKIQQERIQGVKKEGDAAIEKLNEIKTIRQEIYDADTRTYELDILKYQIQIDALQKQIDAANKRKHEIEADTNAKKAQFDIEDKGKFQAALSGMNLSDEMKSALEYVSNPVKNQPLSYSYQAALDAANAQAKLKESQAGADYALENISQSQYSQQMQESALQRALLAKYALSKIDAQHQLELNRLRAQGKTTDELRVVEKHQMDEKSAALEMYAKAYTDWQTYYKEGIDGQYQYELKAIDASVQANQDKATALEDQQKELQMKMKEMSNQMALDLLPVDQAIRDITAETRGWGYSFDQVRAGMAPLVAEVQSSFATMKTAIESIKPLEIPVTIPNLQNIMNQLTGLQQAVFSGTVGNSYTPSSYSGGSSSSSSGSSSEWTPVVSDSSGYNPYTQTAPSDSGINTNANWSAGGDSEWFSSGYTATGYTSGGYTGDGIGIGDKLLAKVGASEWIIPNRDFRSYSNDLVSAALARASYQNIQGGTNYFSFGNVYGVDDLEAAIAGGITKASKASGFANSNYLTGSF